jgi:hypothetical protein
MGRSKNSNGVQMKVYAFGDHNYSADYVIPVFYDKIEKTLTDASFAPNSIDTRPSEVIVKPFQESTELRFFLPPTSIAARFKPLKPFKPFNKHRHKYLLPDISRTPTLTVSERCKVFLAQKYAYLEFYQVTSTVEESYFLVHYPSLINPFDVEKSLYYWAAEELGYQGGIGGKSLGMTVLLEYKLELLKQTPLFYSEQSHGWCFTEEFLADLETQNFHVGVEYSLIWDNQQEANFPAREDIFHLTRAMHRNQLAKYHEYKRKQAEALLTPNIQSSIPETIKYNLQLAIQSINELEVANFDTEPTQIISLIAQYLQQKPDAEVIQKLKTINLVHLTEMEQRNQTINLAYLWADQLRKHYNWTWNNTQGTWFISHPKHESINPIKLITDILEQSSPSSMLTTLFLQFESTKLIFENTKPNLPEVVQAGINMGLHVLRPLSEFTQEEDPNQIISFIAQYLYQTPSRHFNNDKKRGLAFLWAEQLHRQYNWVWLEKNGTWYITHPSHEDINPIELRNCP